MTETRRAQESTYQAERADARRILVAIDASETSQRVADFVNDFFGDLDVRITAVNVGAVPLTWVPSGIAPGAIFAWPLAPPLPASAEDHNEIVSDAGQRLIDRSGVHDDDRIVEVGNPVDTIIRVALENGVDMIVVGSRHKSLLDRFLTGSVSKELALSAPLPVLVVH